MLHRDIVRASLVFSSREEANWHMFDRLKAHKWRLVISFHPLIVKLLESFFETVHGPVLFRLNRAGHFAIHCFISITDILGEVVAYSLQVTRPIWSIVCVNAKVILQAHDYLVVTLDSVAFRAHLGVETRGQLHDLVDVVDMELALKMCQTIEHLDSALAVANVEDFVHSSLLFDHFNVGDVVVNAHVGPCVHPVVIVFFSVECFVLLGVFRATIVADPHIITGIDQ